ncbi:formin-like protein 7 [Acanthopagrus latus]|uniref:formin-like protein 7 n=1 Tax=Acanthopagrus latus TaxID=8177 RepID=UPI00187CF961|nr:formin-like protein 7 [Acanthopagrus latus]
MGILTQLLWASTEQFLETPPPPPPPPVSPTPSQPLRKVSPGCEGRGSWSGQRGSAAGGVLPSTEPTVVYCLTWWTSHLLQRARRRPPQRQPGIIGPRRDAPPPRHQSPVNNVGSPPATLSRRLEDDGPSSPVPLSRTTDGTPPRTQTSVTNLVGSPPVRLSCSLGVPATPCCSPVAKMARLKTPSPAGLSQTIKAAAYHSPRPAKFTNTAWTPSSTCWPWIIDDGLSTSHSPSKEVPVSASIRASHSQSDMRYRKFSRNHQCTCMSLTFLAYQNEGCQFNTAALDRVLAKGDSLYVGVKQQLIWEKRFRSDHLAV